VNPPATKVRAVVFRAPVRPAGTVNDSVTVPVKPFMAVTVISVSPIRGPCGVPSAACQAVTSGPILDEDEVRTKSGPGTTVTETGFVLDNVLGLVPVVPVMVKVKVDGLGTLVQLTVKVAPETLAVQPVGAALVENVTAPAKPLIATDDNVEELVPVPPVGIETLSETGLADTLKSRTVTLTLVTLDRVLGAVPVVPVMGTLNGATPVAHVTDRTVPVIDPLQPVGNVKPELTARVTVPENPLREVTTTVEEPETVARVVIAGPATEKSTTWKVTELDRMLSGVPVTVAE